MKSLPRRRCGRALVAACVLTLSALCIQPARAQFYRQTNLVSDIGGLAALTDPLLKNPWGVSFGPSTPFWVSNQVTSTSTIYAVNPLTDGVSKFPLNVTIPGEPTGQVFNGTTGFVVGTGAAAGPATFIFAALNGTISGWRQPLGTTAVVAATGAAPAVYTGLAMAFRGSNPYLYAANVAGSRVDVFDKSFVPVALPGSFTDPNLPAGNKPFNVVPIGGDIFVTYEGPSGIVNKFDVDGHFLGRFATGGTLVNPWGVTVAPADFGVFSHAILVGNFNFGNPANGAGWISAFNPTTGAFLGLLKGTDTKAIALDGLWSLTPGNGTRAGSVEKVYFTAGIQGQMHGLFGDLAVCHGPVLTDVSVTPKMLWPPNHKLVLVTVNYKLTDDCDPTATASLKVKSNEPVTGTGSGDTAPDWVIVDAHHVLLRAERAGAGSGRVYTITITAVDSMGLTSSATVTVTVPHDHR